MLPLHSLAAVFSTLSLYLIAALLALIVIWLYTPRLRLASATSPAMRAAPIAPIMPTPPRYRPDTFSARIKRGFVHATIREYESIGYRRVQITDAGADYVIVVMDRNGRDRSAGEANW